MGKTRSAAAAGGTLLLAVALAGCSGSTATPPPSSSGPVTSAAPAAPAQAWLGRFGLAGKDAVQAIDYLDRLGGPARPADLMASVRPDELVLSSGTEQQRLEIPKDRFYVSVAPYVASTHPCFYHSLTTCQGELTGQDVHVQITDARTGAVLVEQTRTTFANGFVGFWLPRGLTGTLRVSAAGKTGQVPLSTAADAPTCLTTVRLA